MTYRRNSTRKGSIIMHFTPHHKVEVQEQNSTSVSLICNHPDIHKWLYTRCLIWDCDCISKIGDSECNTCMHTKPILSVLITPQSTIMILYSSNHACSLEPNKDIFTALVNPSCAEFNKYMKTASKQVNAISVEVPGCVLSDNEMYFDPGFISTVCSFKSSWEN